MRPSSSAFDNVIGEALVERQICCLRFFCFLDDAEVLGDCGDVKLVDGDFLLARLLAPVFGRFTKQRRVRVILRHMRGAMVEEQIFGEPALIFGDGGEALDAFGVDDGEIETGLGAVVEENGVDHFARAGGQSEGDVGNAENGADVRNLFLDQADAFDGFDRAADVVFVAGGAGEDQRIEDDVFGARCRIFR